ncbi:DUF6247 family protein [Nocardia sp. CA-128927]|uniref:DUF6247 family protein n=1 Tax=Nocardia sp. CA-128927 TaxID=3239975 RepID=UPI003D97E635
MELRESSGSSALTEPSVPSALREIRNALVGSERVDFERRYGEELVAAASSLDLTGVFAVLDSFREVAEITRRHGTDAHIRMLAHVTDLQQGRDVANTTAAATHRAEIYAKLGL